MNAQKLHKVGICDTTLRDAHQSLLATRMTTADILELAPLMDEVGYASAEVWGGATYDSCMRFLDENPWNRLRAIRKAMPKTRLQMLLRGQNMVGYRHYSDSELDAFIKHAVANGIDMIRIFDALNDVRNLERAMATTKKEGALVQAGMSYTISPIHNVPYYVDLAVKLRDMGADSICIKDMAGLLLPYPAYELVSAIKEKTGLPVQMHCHYTSGQASMTYMKSIEAGADVLDCAVSAMALSTSQPSIGAMVAALQGTQFDTGLDMSKISEINSLAKEIRKHYAKFDNADSRVDTNVLRYQMPGGMISNFISQLKETNSLDKLEAALEEVPRVRADMGYPPLVTPTSQIVGSQALVNVLTGERYKMATNEVKNYFRGEYGTPPGPVNEEIRKKVVGDAKVITCRPADLITSTFDDARRESAAVGGKNDEDALLYVMFPQVAKTFFENRAAGEDNVEYEMLKTEKSGNADITYVPIA